LKIPSQIFFQSSRLGGRLNDDKILSCHNPRFLKMFCQVA